MMGRWQIASYIIDRPLFGLAAVVVSLLVPASGCDNSTESCADDGCEGNIDARMCLNIIPYDDNLEICDLLAIQFVDSEGLVHIPEGCDLSPWPDDWPSLQIAACSTPGPSVQWIDVTVAQDASRTTTQRIILAEHNYCGREIAYSDVTLHDDGPPTFQETLYVSPCDGGGLQSEF